MRATTAFFEPEALIVPDKTWPPWIFRCMG
jgi:hypothetical protein